MSIFRIQCKRARFKWKRKTPVPNVEIVRKMIMKCIVNMKYIREIVRPMDHSSQIEEESFVKIRDNSSQLLDKEKKKKNVEAIDGEVFSFCFCNGERVSMRNISRGKVGQARRNEPTQSCHFRTGQFHGNERWSEDDSRRLTRRTSRRVKRSTG